MKPIHKTFSLLPLAALTLLFGAETYQKPPKAVLDVFNAPTTPALVLSPTHDFALDAQPVVYPPIAELAEPMLRIAGMRINPKTNGLHNVTFASSLKLGKIPEGTEIAVALPVAYGLGRAGNSQLYGVRPADFGVLAGGTLLLAMVAGIAGYVPALRASRVDPLVALRYE